MNLAILGAPLKLIRPIGSDFSSLKRLLDGRGFLGGEYAPSVDAAAKTKD